MFHSLVKNLESPVVQFEHDAEALCKKSHHATDRRYPLKLSKTKPPQQNAAISRTPPHIDLSQKPYMPPVLDQGQLGCCGAGAMANSLSFLLGKEGLTQWVASRLAMYYNARVLIEGSPAKDDTGVALEDLCTAVEKYHVFPETLWPYCIDKFADKPPKVPEKDEHKVFAAHPVPQKLNDIRACLSAGFPILIGIQVYDSFESQAVADSGIVPIPNKSENCLGGHALLLVGFDDTTKAFLVMNDWGSNTTDGEGWGLNGTGYCVFPYEYLLDPDLASDFWCVQLFR